MDIPAPRPGHAPAAQRARSSSAAKPGSLHVNMPVSMASHASTRASTSSRPSRTGKDRERPLRAKDRHSLALQSIRHFLKGRSSYDVLPVSFRLVVLDTKLVVKPALDVMWQAGVVSAPLWQSTPPELLAANSDEAAAKHDQAAKPEGSTSAATSDKASAPLEATAGSQTEDAPGNSPTPATTEGAQDAPATSTEAADGAAQADGDAPGAEPDAATGDQAGEDSGSPGRVSPKTQQESAGQDGAPSATPTKTQAPQKAKKQYPESGFAGMLTVSDIIHLIQYYYHHSSYDSAAEDVEKFRLERLRDIEQALNVPPPPLLSVHPLRPVFDACELLIKTHARRLPLLDYDEQTGLEAVVSVLTQYRVLKFIAMNCRETAGLWRSLRSLGIGTYSHAYKASRSRAPGSGTASHRGSDASEPRLVRSEHGPVMSMSEIEPTQPAEPEPLAPDSVEAAGGSGGGAGASLGPEPLMQSPVSALQSTDPHYPLATATLDTTVFDVVHMFSERGISAVPILDEEGYVVDMYETVDVIALDLTIRQALERRPPDFGGIWTCSPEDSLANIFALLRKRRVHRWLILEPEGPDPRGGGNDGSKASDAASASDANGEKQSSADGLDDFDSDEGLEDVEDEATKERKRREAIVNDPTLSLDDRLEKGDPIRRTRGKLVGILCLSDLLKYVIGSQSGHSPSSTEAGPTTKASRMGSLPRSRGTSAASEPPPLQARRGSSAGATHQGGDVGGGAAAGQAGFDSVAEDQAAERNGEQQADTGVDQVEQKEQQTEDVEQQQQQQQGEASTLSTAPAQQDESQP
ncbi:related to SNF4 - nuclear regulatory protein [Pseudozyma flocculosa]|uniref:Related to SNF4 - nuclear regulatory protein n=1 Tax=Pseudozyma flocculosa TaxID=84751 RepID=A0A5C3ET68_9BASI|nr:related to SNF4 - nuclear regulatory protein [Pseudozyma flocculosa]